MNWGQLSARKDNGRPKTLLLIAMKLIRPGKRKVQILANVIESTLQKRICQTVN